MLPVEEEEPPLFFLDTVGSPIEEAVANEEPEPAVAKQPAEPKTEFPKPAEPEPAVTNPKAVKAKVRAGPTILDMMPEPSDMLRSQMPLIGDSPPPWRANKTYIPPPKPRPPPPSPKPSPPPRPPPLHLLRQAEERVRDGVRTPPKKAAMPPAKENSTQAKSKSTCPLRLYDENGRRLDTGRGRGQHHEYWAGYFKAKQRGPRAFGEYLRIAGPPPKRQRPQPEP